MKATLALGSAIDKLPALALLVLASVWVYPAPIALAYSQQNHVAKSALVFDIKQKEELQKIYGKSAVESPRKKLENSLREYLAKRKSPLAECSGIILDQKNWPKILSLANAESGLGRAYPPSTNNLWGVGGSDLWIMGPTVCDAVPKMNEFLANHPKRAIVKYQDMDIEDMCGLYKQPCYAGHHWIYNNTKILDDLAKLQKSAYGTPVADAKSVTLASK